MIKSGILKELSNLDLKMYVFSQPVSSCIGDRVYIKERIKGIKPYSVLTLHGFSLSCENVIFFLKDENENICSVNRECFYPYKGQDLRKQKIYDNVVFAVTLTILSAVIAVFAFNPNLTMYALHYKG